MLNDKQSCYRHDGHLITIIPRDVFSDFVQSSRWWSWYLNVSPFLPFSHALIYLHYINFYLQYFYLFFYYYIFIYFYLFIFITVFLFAGSDEDLFMQIKRLKKSFWLFTWDSVLSCFCKNQWLISWQLIRLVKEKLSFLICSWFVQKHNEFLSIFSKAPYN